MKINICQKILLAGIFLLFIFPGQSYAKVIITKGPGSSSLKTASDFYEVETFNLGCYNATGLAVPLVAAPKNIPLTFLHAGNCQGIVLALYNASATSTRTVTVNLKDAGSVIRATKTLTPSEITNTLNDAGGTAQISIITSTFIVPFIFDTPYAVPSGAGWSIDVYQSAGAGDWNFKQSTTAGSVFYAVWCDNQVSHVDNDAIIAKDVLVIDKNALIDGVPGTGDTTTRASALVVCKGATGTTDNVVWENPPLASYTLSVKGIILLGSHSGFRAGTAANPIPIAQQAIISFRDPTGLSATACGFHEPDTATATTTIASRKMNLYLYGQTPDELVSPQLRWTTLAGDVTTNAVTTSQPTGWAIGDVVMLGGQDVKGAGTTTVHVIQNISGTSITLNAPVTTLRKAGHPIIKLSGYGIKLEGLGATEALRPFHN